MSKFYLYLVLFGLLASGIFFLQADDVQAATTYYVRPGGGSSTQCTGTTNTDYPGSGTGQNCAFSHPFYVFPPGGSAQMAGGDTLIIANGSYQIGYGAPNTSSCSAGGSYGCTMPAIPSGPSSSQPTRILGEGWNNGCATKPELHGVERVWQIMDLTSSDNVELQCLEITDRSDCIEFHSGSYECERNNDPYGQWASVGLIASDSENVLLKNLDIHGLAHTGIHAGRLQDWTIEDTNISYNGWVGWDGDIGGAGSSNSGNMIFRRVSIDYNGCGEDSGGNPVGCWAQTAGGYGDGLGTENTAGNWTFEDSTFLHNTSDGLDLLYHRLGGSITIRRTHVEGNAGDQIKVTGNAVLSDNVIVSNCGFFNGKSFTHHVDNCRSGGSAVAMNFDSQSNQASLYNNSLYSEGDCLVIAESGGVQSSVKSRNNIFYGGVDFHQNYENSCLMWSDSSSSISFDNDYSLVYNAKEGNGYLCSDGGNNLCGDNPLYTTVGTNISAYNLLIEENSPTIDAGVQESGVTSLDFCKHSRPYGDGVDMGAYEYGSTSGNGDPDPDPDPDEDEDEETDDDNADNDDGANDETDNNGNPTDTEDNSKDTCPTTPNSSTYSIVTGAGFSGGPQVRTFSTAGRATPNDFFAYQEHIRSGVKVATGDVNGDGVDEIITGTGSGGGPHIRIFTKAGNVYHPGFFAYAEHFRGGVNVAAGDLDGDGKDEIIAGAGNGGGPHIRVFDGQGNPKLTNGFFAYDSAFRGGVNVAAGDIDADGQAEIIAGAGQGGGPHVRVFEGNGQLKPITFFAFHPDSRSGISVAAADFDNDGKDEIVAGQLAEAETWVKVYRYNNAKAVLGEFRAYGAGVESGVNVAAADINGDNSAEIITGPNVGGGPQVRVLGLDGGEVSTSFFAYGNSFRGGVYVAVGDFE